MSNISRRDFLKTGAAALAGITIAPSSILGKRHWQESPLPQAAFWVKVMVTFPQRIK